MKKFILSLLIMFGCLQAFEQNIGTVELKTAGGYKEKNLSKAPKKVYIDQFRVIYQLMYIDEEKKSGGREIGGGYRGDVKVSLALGLKGPSEKDLLEVTDELYTEFIEKLKANGFEIINADAAAGIKEFEGWERKKGGELNEAQFKGYATSMPSNFEYFVKGTKNSGKEKSTFIDNNVRISRQLDDAIVIAVNVLVPFCVEAESQGSKMLGKIAGGVAKVVAETNLHLANDMVTSGAFSTDVGSTRMTVQCADNLQPRAVAYFQLKKDVEIGGVVEKKKYKVSESAQTDLWGTDAGLFRVFNVDDKFLKKVQPIEVAAEKYKSGVKMAASKFINASLDEALSYAK